MKESIATQGNIHRSPFFTTLMALALLCAGARQVAALSTPPTTVRNFQCYAIKPFAFTSIPSVSIVDQFGGSTVTVRRPDQLCAPADKNDEDPTAPADPDHLTRYKVVRGAEPKLEQQKIVNQFGTIQLDVIGAMSLMVPSAKSLAAPAPPAPANPAVDHFQCYKVRVSTGAPRFHKIVGVKVDDQFGTGTFDLLEPKRLCAPADKNNEDPGAEGHPDHLLCYKVKAPAPFNTLRVWLSDQFGALSRLRLIQRQEFCVPSLKNPLPTTTTSTTTSTTSSSTTSTTSTTTTSTTTSTTSSTTTSTTSSTTSTTMSTCPVIPPGCNGPLTIPQGCPCSLNCSNCVGSVCNTVTGFCE
jgi:hypothetical protein